MKPSCVLLLVALIGCAANPYQDYYTDQTGGANLSAMTDQVVLLPNGDEPIIRQGTSIDADNLAMYENGYQLVGYSNFNGVEAAQSGLISQAKLVRATHVISYQVYSNTVSGSMPLVLPGLPQQQTTNHSGSIYGSGGYANYSGTSTTTVQGQPTVTSIPYSVNRFDFGASYWVRLRQKPGFGTAWTPLSDETRRRLGTNRGCEITIVYNDTNAYYSDVLRGDVLIAVAGEPVANPEQCANAMEKNRGSTVKMEFLRDGEKRVIDAPIGSPGPW